MNTYTLSSLHVGTSHYFSIVIESEMMDLFGKITGDCNPIHTQLDAAHNRGFKDRVVYGLLTASFYSTLVGVYLPGLNSLLHKTDIDYIRPVYIGDQLTIGGAVTHINRTYKQIEIKATITNQNQELVSRANIKTGLNE